MGNSNLRQLLEPLCEDESLLSPGEILFDRYLVIKQINNGRVFLVSDNITQKMLALKVAPRETIYTEEYNLRREYINHSVFDSNYIVKIYEAIENKDIFGFLMEYVGGGDLSDLLNVGKKPTLDFCLKVFRNICLALSEIHSKDYIHSDIKPENILVTSMGEIKLTDFGLTRNLKYQTENDKETKGTLRYLCPDYLTTGKLSKSSDIYSLGLIIYELLTGKIPFENEDIMCLLKDRVYEEVPSVNSLIKNIPEKFSLIIDKCLTLEGSKKYKDAKELLKDLETISLVTKRERKNSNRIKLFKSLPNRRRQKTTIEPTGSLIKYA